MVRELGVFPPDEPIPERTVLTLWTHGRKLSERRASKLVSDLERKALLRKTGKGPGSRLELHDLQHDYLLAVQKNEPELHCRLLDAYHDLCRDGWPTGPDDG